MVEVYSLMCSSIVILKICLNSCFYFNHLYLYLQVAAFSIVWKIPFMDKKLFPDISEVKNNMFYIMAQNNLKCIFFHPISNFRTATVQFTAFSEVRFPSLMFRIKLCITDNNLFVSLSIYSHLS